MVEVIYLNPGKFGAWEGGVGRASHKFTLSYHQMATIPFRGLADRGKRSAEREREISYSSGKDRLPPFVPLARGRSESWITRDNGNRCKSVVPILLRVYSEIESDR